MKTILFALAMVAIFAGPIIYRTWELFDQLNTIFPTTLN